jgi:hypothetical protein
MYGVCTKIIVTNHPPICKALLVGRCALQTVIELQIRSPSSIVVRCSIRQSLRTVKAGDFACHLMQGTLKLESGGYGLCKQAR